MGEHACSQQLVSRLHWSDHHTVRPQLLVYHSSVDQAPEDMMSVALEVQWIPCSKNYLLGTQLGNTVVGHYWDTTGTEVALVWDTSP